MPLPPAVRAAWGLDGAVERLDGGQGTSVRAGSVVLKPDSDEGFVTWYARLCDRVSSSAFRMPTPLPARDGRLVVDGWSATTFLAGNPVHDEDTAADAWLPVLAASRSLHALLASQPRPAFLDARTDRWARADLIAWNELDAYEIGPRSSALVVGTSYLVEDEGLSPQLVHGDLSGNVLLAAGLAPAVIDISPYWRPAAYADAVVVLDALLWWRAGAELVRIGRPPTVTWAQWRSLLARVLVFRLLAFDELRRDRSEVDDQIPRYAEIAALFTSDVIG